MCVLLPFQRIQPPAHINVSHGCVEVIMPRVIVILLTRQQKELPDPLLTQIPPLTRQANPSNFPVCLSTHSLFKMHVCLFSQEQTKTAFESEVWAGKVVPARYSCRVWQQVKYPCPEGSLKRQ